MADEKKGKSSDSNLDDTKSEVNWHFKTGDQSTSITESPAKPSNQESFSWTASEFISHAKNPGWYLVLVVGTVIVAILMLKLTRDIVTAVFIAIMGGLFGFMGSRQPRELPYTVSDTGLQIGAKQLQYTNFRSFSIVQEVGIESIWLIPMKRFLPATSLYFEPNDKQKIVEVISRHLPMENRELDPFDKLMHQIRF